MKPYYDEDGIQIWNADCREVLPLLPKVDLVLTDPPFSVPVKYHDSDGDYPRSWGDLVVMEPFFAQVFTQLRGIVKPEGQVYVCCDANTYPIFYKAGYSIWNRSHMIVWYKPTGRRGGGWKHAHELIIHFSTSDGSGHDIPGPIHGLWHHAGSREAIGPPRHRHRNRAQVLRHRHRAPTPAGTFRPRAATPTNAGEPAMTELDRIDAEIRAAEQALRSGKPHEDALIVWWSDWMAERRLVETELRLDLRGGNGMV
jgi:hypothetical protein